MLYSGILVNFMIQLYCERDKMKTANKTSLDNAIISHRWLVYKLAQYYKNFGIPIDDLVSEGYIGLTKAAQKFDNDKNCSLKTYATFWIKSYIVNYIISNWSMVKLASSKKIRDMFFKDASQFSKDFSLNIKDEKGREYIDLIDDNDANSEELISEAEEFHMLQNAMEEILPNINERDRDIFQARYLCKKPCTLEMLSLKYNISKERVRQIEATVFEKIKKSVLKNS